MLKKSSENLEAKLEVILFIAGDPLNYQKIAKILGVELAQIPEIVAALAERLKNSGALRIITKDEAVQLVTAPEHAELLETLVKAELREELTPAGLEVLAIVAYRGPIRRSEIEFIRGVNSSYTLRNLLLRGLIDREGSEVDGRAYQYKISFDFLKRLGLGSISELPEYEKISKAISVGKDEEEGFQKGETQIE